MISLVAVGLGKSVRPSEAVLEVGTLYVGIVEVPKQVCLHLTWQWPGTQGDLMKYLIAGTLSTSNT